MMNRTPESAADGVDRVSKPSRSLVKLGEDVNNNKSQLFLEKGREQVSWIVIFVTTLIIYPIVIHMEKHLSLSETYMTVVFGLFVQTLVDTFASFQLKAWGFFEVEKAELKSLWIILAIYPIFATMIINWFPYRASWWKKILYLLAWSTFSTCYEWLTIRVGIMWHMNWNLFYSFLLYPFIYYLLIVHVRVFRWMQNYNSRTD